MKIMFSKCGQEKQKTEGSPSQQLYPILLNAKSPWKNIFSLLLFLYEMMDVNYCGNYFTMYVNQVMLYVLNLAMLYVNYISIELGEADKLQFHNFS